MGLDTPSPLEQRPAADAVESVPVERRAGSPLPEPQAPKSAASAPELPDFAEKADDLEAIKKAVDDAASVGGGLWLSYLFVLFYLAVAAGAVTHEDLFFERPVKLPFLTIELPLLAFFFLAPILFLVVHAYTLVHLVRLTDKAKRFDQVLRDQIGGENVRVRDSLRRQLPSNIFIQFLAGPSDLREGGFGSLLRSIAWITLVIAPILLLLMMQLQFLPYHSNFITWAHRGWLLADLILIWWLWRKILSGREVDGKRRWARWIWSAAGLTLSVCVVFFSWSVATFPGEWHDNRFAAWPIFPTTDRTESRIIQSLHDWVFNSTVDETTRRRGLPFSNTLVLTGLNIYEGLGIDDADGAKARSFLFRVRGRDLRGAIFKFANLQKVDFTGADLQEALLSYARLENASFDDAQLQGAVLFSADLEGASLLGARLQGANLLLASAQGASLDAAELQGASLFGARLQGASLDGAQLQGALLDFADLEGASLDGAQLQGASLRAAVVQGASLENAQLQGATLQEAILGGANLSNALLWRTNVAQSSFESEPWALKLSDEREAESPSWNRNGKVLPWNNEAYQDLRRSIESLVPETMQMRREALKRLERLDCGSPILTLAPCNPSRAPPPEAQAWGKSLWGAGVYDIGYVLEQAIALRVVVCEGQKNPRGVSGFTIHINDGVNATREAINFASVESAPYGLYALRGLMLRYEVSRYRGKSLSGLAAAAAEAPALIDFIMSKDCAVSASLTNADKARLLRIKQEAIETAKAAQQSVKSQAPPSP